MYDILIVGSGPAGMSAAIYARRAGYRVLLLESGIPGGQIVNTPEVENYPALAPISGWELAQQFTRQVKALDTETCRGSATAIENTGTFFTVHTTVGDIPTRSVILANGVHRRKLHIPGEQTYLGHGVSFCATCDGSFFRGRDVAVVGGGNTALEDALYLSRLCRQVHLVHRRSDFRGQKLLSDRVAAMPNIHLHLENIPLGISGGHAVDTLIIQNITDNTPSVLSVSGIFVAIGSEAGNRDFSPALALDQNGYLLTDEACRTNLPGIFAAGDTRSKPLRQIVTAASDGAIAASSAAEWLDRQRDSH